MSDAEKLAALLLHLELNPDKLKVYQASKKNATAELKHFGLTDKTINVVVNGDLEEFGKLFLTLKQVGFGAVKGKPRRRKK